MKLPSFYVLFFLLFAALPLLGQSLPAEVIAADSRLAKASEAMIAHLVSRAHAYHICAEKPEIRAKIKSFNRRSQKAIKAYNKAKTTSKKLAASKELLLLIELRLAILDCLPYHDNAVLSPEAEQAEFCKLLGRSHIPELDREYMLAQLELNLYILKHLPGRKKKKWLLQYAQQSIDFIEAMHEVNKGLKKRD
ncbi:hypothetical protein SapgrDRAFT_2307 [Saprospira grandis DSM 2844]|uniref:Uncharacterized protein n=1 Tax=Saprospira grandis DSM 2844 TaxID=694433 RepID=J1I5C6_9BACT|nr:hypothetical protein [Saprospira grandis]EJF53975.1 hypothetical protein SapgrDRAFT_2307 [Saprospira grandis DSM 2844]